MEESEVMRAVRLGLFQTLDVATQSSNVCIDLTRHRTRVFNDRENDGTYPEYCRLQNPGRHHR